MLGDAYPDQTCSIARALELVGERWTLLVLRDVFLGVHRFDAIQGDLGVARNILQARLGKLVDAGLLEKRPYSTRPPRHEYHLTPAGEALWPALNALMVWGDEHVPTPGGPPVVNVHRGACGGTVDIHCRCMACGATLERREVRSTAGPGAAPTHPLRVREAAREAATQMS